MKLRKLARLCEHDRLEPHYWMRYEHGVSAVGFDCPGGVFLPDDTLIDREALAAALNEVGPITAGPVSPRLRIIVVAAQAYLALTQEPT